MKRVLSFLLMIVFLQMQVTTVFAKHGGPDFGGTGGGIDTIGTYAGTLVPVNSTTSSSNTSFSNSIERSFRSETERLVSNIGIWTFSDAVKVGRR